MKTQNGNLYLCQLPAKKMQIIYSSSINLVSFIILIFSWLSMISTSVPASASSSISGDVPSSYYSSWLNTSFNPKADIPYRQIAEQIDVLEKQDKITQQIIHTYHDAYSADPRDSLKAFAYACALDQAGRQAKPVDAGIYPGDSTFEKAPVPESYTYIRLRFIANCESVPSPEFIALAKRLLAIDPDDYTVKFFLIQCFPVWKSKEDEEAALHYTNQLFEQRIHKANTMMLLAWVYSARWEVLRDKGDKAQSIKIYQDALKLTNLPISMAQQARHMLYLIRNS